MTKCVLTLMITVCLQYLAFQNLHQQYVVCFMHKLPYKVSNESVLKACVNFACNPMLSIQGAKDF